MATGAPMTNVARQLKMVAAPPEHHPQYEAGGAGRGEDTERLRPLRPFAEHLQQQGQRCRRCEGSGDTLDETRSNKSFAAVDETAGDAGAGKDGQRPEKDAATTENVGNASAEQQKTAITKHIGADRPLQRCRLDAELGLNGGQGDADRRNIHGVEEIGGAEQQQRQPGSALGFGNCH